MNSLIMRRALEYSKAVGAPIISHCEDLSLSEDGVMNEGKLSFYLGLKGIPKASEEVMVSRDVILSKHFKTSVHIAHVSTKGSVEIIKKQRKKEYLSQLKLVHTILHLQKKLFQAITQMRR